MIRAALSLALLAAMAAPAAAQGAYFAAIDDVPLPPGFAEAGGGWSFEGEAGRIVEARAQGAASGLEVRDFYDVALPPLGWAVSPQTDGTLAFVRGREMLTFSVWTEAGATQLSARLVIQPASMARD